MIPLWLKVILLGFIGMCALVGIGRTFGLRYNTSVSEPRGVYALTDQPTDYVSFCLPRPVADLALARGYISGGSCDELDMAPVVKEIVARPGDLVDYSAEGIRVNGGAVLPRTAPLPWDSHGRGLRHYPFGRYRVSRGMAWTISNYDARSFDSRYFGPVAMSDFIAHVRPLITERSRQTLSSSASVPSPAR